MDLLLRFYVQNLWWLGYISIKSPTTLHRSGLKTQLLSLPGILNILHCLCTLITLVETWNTLQAVKIPLSNHMLVMVTIFVNMGAVNLVRIISAKTSVDFLRNLIQLEEWGSSEQGWPQRGRKIVWVAVALVSGSTLCALHMTVTILVSGIAGLGATGAVLESWPIAYMVSYWFAAFSDFTAIPFALSYVVILGSKIVDMYKHLASSFTRNLQNQGETWEAKKRFKLLQLYKRRFCRIANYYCFCTVAQSATALLEILGLATQNISSITTNDTLVLYVTLNFVTLAFLAYAGNTFETEVK